MIYLLKSDGNTVEYKTGKPLLNITLKNDKLAKIS